MQRMKSSYIPRAIQASPLRAKTPLLAAAASGDVQAYSIARRECDQ